MADLSTLAEVRSRLDLTVDTERDAVLDAFRLAAEEKILDLTGFVVSDDPYFAPVLKVDTLSDVQAGVSRLLRYRPVLSAAMAVRSLGDTAFAAARSDIRDAAKGRVMLLASDFLTSVDPVTGYPLGPRPPWARWQERTWATVRCTYEVDPLGSETNPVSASLNRAVVEWAAFFFSVPSHGAVQSYSAESISETFSTFDEAEIPRTVRVLITRYLRGQAGIVV